MINPAAISLYDALFPQSEFPLEWHMTFAERTALLQLLQVAQPAVAIEIGTFRGGSLQVLSRYCPQVYSIDIDPSVSEKLSARFPTVKFLTGDSSILLPDLLARITADGGGLGFVLVDGDHTPQGVKRDIDLLLQYKPTCPLLIAMHDSFNPGCRAGMKMAQWASSPYVHFVELDFVPGQIVPYDTSEAYGEMWGGLGLALLLPTARTRPLVVDELYQLNFESAPRWLSETFLKRRLNRNS